MEKGPQVQAVESWLQPDVFKALADESRLAVLARIVMAGRAMTVSEIQGCCGIHLSGVSRHLRQLRSAGLVEAEKQYLEGLATAGLVDLEVTERLVYDETQIRGMLGSDLAALGVPPDLLDAHLSTVVGKVWSAKIIGRKA